MNRLDTTFAALRDTGQAALTPFITAGDPSPDATPALMHTLVAAGADVIELGVPFSDPMADGPAIQSACERALAAGTTLADVLEIVAKFRRDDDSTPVILMGYFNPIDAMGLAAFTERATAAGVDGVLVVDMTAEEAPDTLPLIADAGLAPICLVAPTTSDERIQRICNHAGGFVYYVSTKGVTGGEGIDTARLADEITRIRPYTSLPVAVGFGVREPADAAAVANVADAVVIGSSLVRQVATYNGSLDDTRNRLHETLAAMRQAMNSAMNSIPKTSKTTRENA
ncbi:tryptophan synthase subunit alpha [Salinisphaera sp. USBA-960]|uniref:tryptophan synthase subunit alpha n=1 Tax=Salinisphaera orenii TaxID=856731 RepID=UPI000DBE8486|nr:tryptophan synthase subunit alpha [Salifodinibacter halophilus]NNC26106.1 tryptophan synthase subunit alpha [Salifodinibacter halophilus]